MNFLGGHNKNTEVHILNVSVIIMRRNLEFYPLNEKKTSNQRSDFLLHIQRLFLLLVLSLLDVCTPGHRSVLASCFIQPLGRRCLVSCPCWRPCRSMAAWLHVALARPRFTLALRRESACSTNTDSCWYLSQFQASAEEFQIRFSRPRLIGWHQEGSLSDYKRAGEEPFVL